MPVLAEVADYNVYPSDEGRELLYQEALDRIVAGKPDRLDEFELPADDAGVLRGRFTVAHETGYSIHESSFTSSAPNARVREFLIRAIAVGDLQPAPMRASAPKPIAESSGIHERRAEERSARQRSLRRWGHLLGSDARYK